MSNKEYESDSYKKMTRGWTTIFPMSIIICLIGGSIVVTVSPYPAHDVAMALLAVLVPSLLVIGVLFRRSYNEANRQQVAERDSKPNQ